MGIMLNRRRAYGGKKGLLPSGYVRLEYIENTRNAYIDTGIYSNNDIKIETHHTIEASSQEWSVFWGCAEPSHSLSLQMHNFHYHAVCFNAGSSINVPMFSDSSKDYTYTYEVHGNILTYKDATHNNNYSIEGSVEQNNYSLYLFAYNEVGQTTWRTCAKMYYFRIYSNGILVRNFIPCKNPNNVVGMYDTANGVFYSSPNGAPFVAGPEV